MRHAEPVIDGVAHAVRLRPVLTCRRHIDLQRVCSSLAGASAPHRPAAFPV
ncbi:hypothetical protein OH807_40535 [Kitasatospora sp. NBC_01560]|uniref:hypothetical protein n=1 Tax=Kitasatospora sp. NBC_01560 TaxID=2975965 RepID=UPI00386A7159